MSINGSNVLTHQYLRPRSGGSVLFLRTFQTGTIIHGVKVRRLAQPNHASPIIAADALYREGLLPAALNEYRTLAERYKKESLGEVSSARALQVVMEMNSAQSAHLLEQLSQTFTEDYPQSDYHLSLLMAQTIYRAERKEWAASLETAKSYIKHSGNSHIALVLHRELLKDGEGFTTEQGNILAEMLENASKAGRLSLVGLGLRELPSIPNTKTWQVINLSENRLNNLQALKKVPVNRLDISSHPIRSISQINPDELTMLVAKNTIITNIETLRKARKLRSLALSNTPIKDLSPTDNLPLRSVYLSNTVDVTIGKWPKLHQLSVNHAERVDLSPLINSLALKRFNAGDSTLENIETLSLSPISHLHIPYSSIKTLQTISQKDLRHLNINGTAVSDLSPLKGVALETININNTAIKDIGPLSGMPLQAVSAINTKIDDLSPINSPYLTRLYAQGSPIKNLGPFLKKPLRQFTPWSEALDDKQWLQIAEIWQSEQPELAALTRTWVETKDLPPSQWRAYAESIGQKEYLVIPQQVTAEQALELVAKAGGEIPQAVRADALGISGAPSNDFMWCLFPHDPQARPHLKPQSTRQYEYGVFIGNEPSIRRGSAWSTAWTYIKW